MTTSRQDFHVAVATPDLATAMEEVGRMFGCTWAPVYESVVAGHWTPQGPCDFTMRFTNSRGGLFRLELVEGSPGSIWESDHFALHHIGFASSIFHEEIARLEDEGWSLEQTQRNAQGDPTVYAYLSRPGQARLEVLEAKPKRKP